MGCFSFANFKYPYFNKLGELGKKPGLPKRI